MAEGQGEKNVNEELEFEEQLNGLESDKPADPDQPKPEREDDELEMNQDFDANLEKLMISDAEDNDDDDQDQDDHDDQRAEEADSDAERQQMDKDWTESEGEEKESGNEEEDFDMNKAETIQDGAANKSDNENNNDNSDGDKDFESECEESIASSVQGEAEEGSLRSASDTDDQLSDASSQNPDPDQQDLDANEQVEDIVDQESPLQDIDTDMSLQVDDIGDQERFESAVNDTNVQTNNDTVDSTSKVTDENAHSKTIHDIQSSRTENSAESLAGTSERQLYEHAEQGQTVSGRSMDSSSTAQEQPANEDENREALKQHTNREMNSTDTATCNSTMKQQSSTTVEQDVVIDKYLIKADNSQHQLAVELCERLRLVLEPTLRTRLQGDYKSGKRLNLRKIIPFIASGYRRDKIWLRRSRPAKRDYKVDICVDSSRSMRDHQADQQALTAAVALRDGLQRLEAGTVRLWSFGETVKEFAEGEGEECSFADESSDFCSLLDHIHSDNSIESSSWRLCIIVSDGICQEHQKLRMSVNKCLQSRILPFLVIIDPSGKISDLSHVDFTGKTVTFTRYLSTIPFEHYIIVRDILLLPSLLSDALSQWFQMQ